MTHVKKMSHQLCFGELYPPLLPTTLPKSTKSGTFVQQHPSGTTNKSLVNMAYAEQ